jgi:hypothetical protein
MRGRVDRLADVQPDEADRGAPEASDNLASRPESAVRGELQRRLAELPSGHPSAIADKRQRSGEPGTDGRLDRVESDGTRSGPDRNGQTNWPDLDGQRDPADGAERSFWSDAGPLKELWQDHLTRWPEKQNTAEKPDLRDDPPGSWRGAGDRYLSPEHNADAAKQIELLHKPEAAVTKLLTQIERDNNYGGVLAGFEHRLKGLDRLKEKFVDKMSVKHLNSPADAASMTDDAVRYTFCFGSTDYVAGHHDVQRSLESAGCAMTYRKNHWHDDPHYRGVNSRWETPDGGRFELQFHTRESYYAKQELTHPSYKRLRSPETDWDEIPDLQKFQSIVSSAVPKPPGAELIPDLRRGGSR